MGKYCKKCGKELRLSTTFLKDVDTGIPMTAGIPMTTGRDLCSDCSKEKLKHEKGYCKGCGKKLGFFNKTHYYKDLCFDCFNEEYFVKRCSKEEFKHKKGYCKGCGKKLPTLPQWNLDKSGFLRGVCSDCELKYPAKFYAKYIGGYGAFPEPKEANMRTYHDHLEVPELGLTISYSQMQNVQSMTEEKLKASRILLVGIFAFAWKKRTPYLVITFKDAIGIEQNPVFYVDNISVIQHFLYQQMVNARMG